MGEELQEHVCVAQRGGFARPEQAAPAESRDAVGQAAHGGQVVLYPQHGGAALPPLGQQRFKDLHARAVERGHGFVQQHELRGRQQALGQQHALALAAGEVAHAAAGLVRHAHALQPLQDALAHGAAQAQIQRALLLEHAAHEVLHRHGQRAVGLDGLGHVGQHARRGQRPVQGDLASVRHHAQHGFHQAAFAAAIGADEGVDFTRVHLPVHVLQDARGAQLQVHALQAQGRAGDEAGAGAGGGGAHARAFRDSSMARTTASRLKAMSFSNLSAV